MKILDNTVLIASMLLPSIALAANPGSPESVTSKLRRVAEALEDALVPDLHTIRENPACHMQGGACDVAKREAVELLGHIADAHAQSAPEIAAQAAADTPEGWCQQEGKPCHTMLKHTREIEDTLDGKNVPHQVIAKRDEETEDEAAKVLNCYRTDGGPCLRARFDFFGKNAFTQKLAPDGASHIPTTIKSVDRTCVRVGQVCYKVKRAQEMIMDLVADEEVDENFVADHLDQKGDVKKRAIEQGQPADKLAMAKLRRAVMNMRQARE